MFYFIIYLPHCRVTVPLAGALYWLYVVLEQVSKDEVVKNIGNVAVGARTAMGEVSSGGVPKAMVPLSTSLFLSLSRRVFETRDPSVALQLSNACHNISKSVKSLILVPMFASSGMHLTHLTLEIGFPSLIITYIHVGAIEGIPTLAKGIAEHLQSIKAVNTVQVPSRIVSYRTIYIII